MVLRARCKALFTDATVVSSDSETSRAEKPSTSRMIEHRALGGRQVLQRRDEGELDGLALLVACVRRGIAVPEPQRLVRVGLDPHRLDERLTEVRREVVGGP